MNLKPYENYKDSKITWISRIPEHWEIHKIKNLIFFQEGPGLRNWQFTDNGIRVICVTNITSNGIDFSNYEKFISEEEYKQIYSHFTVNQGDLLLSSSGNSWGKVAEYKDDETVILNTSTIRINKNPSSDYEIIRPYIKWVLQSDYVREQLGLMMTGSCQPNFGPTHLAKVSILMPSINEQKQIACYLDKQTAKIDATIAKNEKLIQLLEDKRVALINQVVTKGLNPDAPMKDSRIEWIGEIPEHWNVHKIKNLIFFQEGPGLRNWQFTDEGIRVICVTNITPKGIDFSNYEKFISEEEYAQNYSHFTVNKGDLLLSSSGNSWGKVAEYKDDETVILNTSTIRINKNPSSDYELIQPYIKWVLQSDYVREQLGLMMTGSCQPNFGPTHLAKILIVLPLIDEQDKIAKYLDYTILNIDNTIDKIKENILLLEEYKTSLIHQVVTGKIDVRGEEI